MRTFTVLLQKEFIGLWRSKKIIWLPIVFMLLSAMQPLTMYFMEDILKMGGGLPEGAVIKIPTPTSGEVMASVLSQLNTIGVLIIVVVAMGAISDERKSGAMTMLLIRPIAPLQLVGSKAIAYGLLLIFSFICGYWFAYYYTVVLFGAIPFHSVLQAMSLYSVYILFIVVCVVFCSAFWDSNATIAIVSIIFISGLTLVSGWFTEALKWSPTRLSGYASSVITGESHIDGIIGCLIVTSVCLLSLLILAAVAVRRKSA
ncbi:MAG: ABC transporter permease [Bacillus sp. (in: firmicutes)]